MLILGGLPAARRRNPSTVKENRRRTGPPPAKPGDDANTKSAATMASVAAAPSGGSSGMDKYYSSKIGDLNSVSDGVPRFLFLCVWLTNLHHPHQRGGASCFIARQQQQLFSSFDSAYSLPYPSFHLSSNILTITI